LIKQLDLDQDQHSECRSGSGSRRIIECKSGITLLGMEKYLLLGLLGKNK
jgi:hypothetical protein